MFWFFLEMQVIAVIEIKEDKWLMTRTLSVEYVYCMTQAHMHAVQWPHVLANGWIRYATINGDCCICCHGMASLSVSVSVWWPQSLKYIATSSFCNLVMLDFCTFLLHVLHNSSTNAYQGSFYFFKASSCPFHQIITS